MTIQNRLNVADEVEHVGHVGERLDAAGRPSQRLKRQRIAGMWGLSALLVTADAAGRLTRLHRHEALHPLDGQVVFVQRDEEDRSHGRHLEVGRPVRLNRDRAQHAFQGERAADR